MDFQNDSLWTLRYIQSFNADSFGAVNVGIQKFNTSVLNENIIKIKCTSSAPISTTSQYVGYVLHKVTLDSGEVSFIDKRSIYLGSQIFELKAFTPFFLTVVPVRRLRQLTLSISEFVG
jgi:hypothetical protein